MAAGVTMLDMLRVEIRELHQALANAGKLYKETVEQRNAIVQFAAALACLVDGRLRVTAEELEAANEACRFRFQLRREQRPDGKWDIVLQTAPVTPEEAAAGAVAPGPGPKLVIG